MDEQFDKSSTISERVNQEIEFFVSDPAQQKIYKEKALNRFLRNLLNEFMQDFIVNSIPALAKQDPLHQAFVSMSLEAHKNNILDSTRKSLMSFVNDKINSFDASLQTEDVQNKMFESYLLKQMKAIHPLVKSYSAKSIDKFAIEKNSPTFPEEEANSLKQHLHNLIKIDFPKLNANDDLIRMKLELIKSRLETKMEPFRQKEEKLQRQERELTDQKENADNLKALMQILSQSPSNGIANRDLQALLLDQANSNMLESQSKIKQSKALNKFRSPAQTLERSIYNKQSELLSTVKTLTDRCFTPQGFTFIS